MTEFRVGDRIEIVHDTWKQVYGGYSRGVIEQIDGGECWVKFDYSVEALGKTSKLMEGVAVLPLHAIAHVSAVDRLGEVSDDELGKLAKSDDAVS